jgi:hypothetical protein
LIGSCILQVLGQELGMEEEVLGTLHAFHAFHALVV